MCPSAKYICITALLLWGSVCASAQLLKIDSVKTALQGSWQMTADTNVVLVFKGDTMTHKMMRSWGSGKAHFMVTDQNCDTARFIRKDALYLIETYRYYHGKQALDGELCNKIIYFKNGTLILKRNGVFESYTRVN